MPLSRRSRRGFLAGAFALLLAAGVRAQSADADTLSPGTSLAPAGDCVSCHPPQGGQPFAGGLRMDTRFGRPLTPNITPDAAAGIGNWSANEFYRALHHGLNQLGQDMLPAMPFDFHTRVTRQDSDALYAHLRSIAPATKPVVVQHLRLPFNQRWSMAVWHELYFNERTCKPGQAKSAAWNRGACLAEDLDHCAGCHPATSRGMPGVFPPLAGNGVVIAPVPAGILQGVLFGVPAQGKYVPMPGFAHQPGNPQEADLAHCLRVSWGNVAVADTAAGLSARLRATGAS